jgi:hypothetical protein
MNALLQHIAEALEKTPGATVILTTDWSLLVETLKMDAQSRAFDRTLRKEIRSALDELIVLEAE